MKICVRLGVSLDGYISTPDGMPVFLLPGYSDGPAAFLQTKYSAMIMGRTTFDPALAQPEWPWPGMPIFVLTSTPLPVETPDNVVAAEDPAVLLELVRSAELDGDVHLVGGQQTVQAFRDLGAINDIGLLFLPILLGGGTPLTAPGSGHFPLQLESTRSFSDGTVKHLYRRSNAAQVGVQG